MIESTSFFRTWFKLNSSGDESDSRLNVIKFEAYFVSRRAGVWWEMWCWFVYHCFGIIIRTVIDTESSISRYSCESVGTCIVRIWVIRGEKIRGNGTRRTVLRRNKRFLQMFNRHVLVLILFNHFLKRLLITRKFSFISMQASDSWLSLLISSRLSSIRISSLDFKSRYFLVDSI